MNCQLLHKLETRGSGVAGGGRTDSTRRVGPIHPMSSLGGCPYPLSSLGRLGRKAVVQVVDRALSRSLAEPRTCGMVTPSENVQSMNKSVTRTSNLGLLALIEGSQ